MVNTASITVDVGAGDIISVSNPTLNEVAIAVPGPQGPPGGNGDPVLVLGPSDPVPPGTAPGTVIVRTQS